MNNIVTDYRQYVDDFNAILFMFCLVSLSSTLQPALMSLSSPLLLPSLP